MEVKGGPHKGGGGELRIEVSVWMGGTRPQEELFVGPKSTGWKTQGAILKALLTVLTGGGMRGVPQGHHPPSTKTVPFMAVLFLKHLSHK